MYNNNYNNNFSTTPYNYGTNNYNIYNKSIEVVRVNGQQGAQAYMLPPNSSILLLDQTAPIVWLKMTDGAGYPTITPYDISPHQTQEQVNQLQTQALEVRLNKLEEMVNELYESTVKSVEQSNNKRVIIKQSTAESD